MNDVAPKDRDIAMVFQSYALYPHMTVFENMAFALKLRKAAQGRRSTEKVQRAADMLGHRAAARSASPRQLSGGQRQRVALGRAIVREPQCFLFDEPLSNLDAKLRVEMRAEIKRAAPGSSSSTTVYVTHDQEEAMTLGDRVVVMKDGVVQQCGERRSRSTTSPANRFVAGFLGTPADELLRGARWSRRAGGSGSTRGRASCRCRRARPRRCARARRRAAEVVLGVRPEAIAPAAPAPLAGGRRRWR